MSASISNLLRAHPWATTLLETASTLWGRRQSAVPARSVPGSGARFAAAGAALKMLEMTAGRVMTHAKLSRLAHGPMSAVHDDTLIVCFCPRRPDCEPMKPSTPGIGPEAAWLFRLSQAKGSPRPPGEEDIAIPYETQSAQNDSLPFLDVISARFWRSSAVWGRLHPTPIAAGVIQRVVRLPCIAERLIRPEVDLRFISYLSYSIFYLPLFAICDKTASRCPPLAQETPYDPAEYLASLLALVLCVDAPVLLAQGRLGHDSRSVTDSTGAVIATPKLLFDLSTNTSPRP